MRKSLLDILACPIEKHSPLDLYDVSLDSTIDMDTPSKNTDNGRKLTYKLLDNKENNLTGKTNMPKAEKISEGLLFCSQCLRFYPIIEEISIMLPYNLRDKDMDLKFLQRWSHKLPESITKQAAPWHL